MLSLTEILHNLEKILEIGDPYGIEEPFETITLEKKFLFVLEKGFCEIKIFPKDPKYYEVFSNYLYIIFKDFTGKSLIEIKSPYHLKTKKDKKNTLKKTLQAFIKFLKFKEKIQKKENCIFEKCLIENLEKNKRLQEFITQCPYQNTLYFSYQSKNKSVGLRFKNKDNKNCYYILNYPTPEFQEFLRSNQYQHRGQHYSLKINTIKRQITQKTYNIFVLFIEKNKNPRFIKKDPYLLQKPMPFKNFHDLISYHQKKS